MIENYSPTQALMNNKIQGMDKFTYEVSLWTLQDSFITVLKWSEYDVKGQIQSPTVELVDDGTRSFSFSIPKFYYDGIDKIINPLWTTVEELPIEANMHKLKVIFNKNTPDEAVEEFLVTSVVETHEKDQIIIDITSEGLAFHELGKIGYKIALSADNFILETEEWFKSGMPGTSAPKNNIQYWNDLVFKDKQGNWKSYWRYDIQMDWSSYSQSARRQSNIVYEDEYVSSWTTDDSFLFWPRNIEIFKEKLRLVEAKESNIYNITQDIAKTFGVYCKYQYEYDDSYHITERKVIYYNNYLQESRLDDNVLTTHLDLTYPYSSSLVKRTIDSTDIITKMYVHTVDSNATDSNIVSIMNVDANKSKEDYLLNFDYLHQIGTITDEQYEEISIYEAKMNKINTELIVVESKLQVLQNELIDARAKETLYTNAIQLDQERYDNAIGLRNALTGGSKDIPIEEAKPGTLVVHKDVEGGRGYYVNLNYEGLDTGSVRLYSQIDYTAKIGQGRLKGLNTSGNYIYDEFNNLTEIDNIVFPSGSTIPTVMYMTGLYCPWLYYDKVARVWISRKAQDTKALNEAKEYISKLLWDIYGSRADYAIVGVAKAGDIDSDTLGTIAQVSTTRAGECRVVDENNQDTDFSELDIISPELMWNYEYLLSQKQILINSFERMMGPALREGYWTPEDYQDYGDKYLDKFTISNSSILPSTSMVSFSWDGDKLYDNEEGVIFQSSIDGSMEQYIIVNISSYLDKLIPYLDDLSFIYYDKTAVDTISKMVAKDHSYSENSDNWTPAQQQVIRSEVARLKDTNLVRSFTIGSQCELGYIRAKNNNNTMSYTPVLIITGSKLLTTEQIKFIVNPDSGDDPNNEYRPFLGQFKPKVTNTTITYDINPIVTNLSFIGNAGVTLENVTFDTYDYQRVFPRIFIKSLKLKNTSDELLINLNNNILTNFEDYYSIVDERTKDDVTQVGYYITLKPEKLFAQGSKQLQIDISYSLSNADVSIYLDAIKVMKENAYPKVSYEVQLCALDYSLIRTAYNKLNYIVHINDIDLQLQDVCGYISSISLVLDKPWETTAEIKNYETKFEDLFSTIVAQTEAMQKNEGAINHILDSFSPTGEIVGSLLQDSIVKADLNYSFNQGKLTIDQENGIWGLSDSGVVAFRGGGIFTATSKDSNGNWQWNTGILPQGINANLITSGQLDTNRIKIYAGDQIRFQLNGDGLFAYKSFYSDQIVGSSSNQTEAYKQTQDLTNNIDANQYVVFNENGLFLTVKKGAWILNKDKTAYTQMDNDVNRVEVSWNGFILRNRQGHEVFFANPETGDLTLKGRIESNDGEIGGWSIQSNLLANKYINLRSGDDDPGIFLTPSVSASLKTVSYQGETYYAYKRTDTSGDSTVYYLKTTPSNYDTEITVTSYYVYQNTPTNVAPKYTYTRTTTTSSNSNSSGMFSDEGENYTYTDATLTQNKTTKIYIVGYNGSQTPLQYNGVEIEYNYNTSLTAPWYANQLVPGYSSNLNNLVTYTYTSELKLRSGGSIRLKLDTFQPSFSVRAKTGEVMISNGTLGNFQLSSTRLTSDYKMTIATTNLSGDNRVEGNVNYTLSKYKNCFCGFSSDNANGTFTLTNVAGGQTTFNIAATQFFQNSVAAAGRLLNPDSWNSGTNVIFYIESGYGNTHTRTHDATAIYNRGKKAGKDSVTIPNNGMFAGFWSLYSGRIYTTTVTAKASNGASNSLSVFYDASGDYKAGWNACLTDIGIWASNVYTLNSITAYDSNGNKLSGVYTIKNSYYIAGKK